MVVNDPTKAFAQFQALQEIENCTNMQELKNVASNLVRAYFSQKMMLEQMMRDSFGKPPAVKPSALARYEDGVRYDLP